MLEIVFASQRKTGALDLEAVELLVRNSMHQAGALALGRLLSCSAAGAAHQPCRCGGETKLQSLRSRQLLTAVGEVDFQRPYYHCPRCHQGHSPLDQQLDIAGTAYSPGVRRMLATVGADSSFQQGRDQLELLAGLSLTVKAVERQAEAVGLAIEQSEQRQIQAAKQLELPAVCVPDVPVLYVEMDGTGVPVTSKEREGRASKTEGQPVRTREVKLGCVFTQTLTDKDGWPVRDPDSTSYVAAIEGAEPFGLRLYTEAWRRGWSRAAKKIVLGDGAVWIWNLADQHFVGVLKIVDLFHTRQHIWELAAKLFPAHEPQRQQWARVAQYLLDQGAIETLVFVLRKLQSQYPDLIQALENAADYFQRNAERMRYPEFRAQGLFVGSGVVEARCRSVVGKRLKCSGMFWTVRGANAILALRCCRLSGSFENYWESRSRAA